MYNEKHPEQVTTLQERIASLSGIDIASNGQDQPETLAWRTEIMNPEAIRLLIEKLGEAALSSDPNEFVNFVQVNKNILYEACWVDPEVKDLLLLGYKLGVARGNALCMHELGALYYMGDIVEQDYQEAAKFYQMAADAGCIQSLINLGYIYEYGRLGEPDYKKAFDYYSLAAVLAPSSEATYKLGDLYNHGRGATQHHMTAYKLYERSYELAEGPAEKAHPALRIAEILIGDRRKQYGDMSNLLRALYLFQTAEIGLREEIQDGLYYYQKQLTRAIEGQEKTRELIREEEETIID